MSDLHLPAYVSYATFWSGRPGRVARLLACLCTDSPLSSNTGPGDSLLVVHLEQLDRLSCLLADASRELAASCLTGSLTQASAASASPVAASASHTAARRQPRSLCWQCRPQRDRSRESGACFAVTAGSSPRLELGVPSDQDHDKEYVAAATALSSQPPSVLQLP